MGIRAGEGHDPSPKPEAGVAPAPAGRARRDQDQPAAAFTAYPDPTTRLDVAVWEGRAAADGPAARYSLTCGRASQDADGVWTADPFWRPQDIEALLSLVQRAYDWALDAGGEVQVKTVSP